MLRTLSAVKYLRKRFFTRNKHERKSYVWCVKTFRSVPVKYEKVKDATNAEPGLIKVYTVKERDDGTTETVTEHFNTVSNLKNFYDTLF